MKHSVIGNIARKAPSQRGFTSKVLAVALTASLAPTLLLASMLVGGLRPDSPQIGFVILLLVVAVAAGFTLWQIRNLLRPVEVLTKFVDTYVSTGEIEDVPEEMDAELGGLIRNTRNAIVRLDLTNRELAIVSKLDLLTGLPNRGVSMQRLELDVARSNRSLTHLTLVSIDIDDFRRLNDKYGIAVGDACLRHFADLARSCIREGDWIARWGADEFLLLLWDTEFQNADIVISRIRYKLENSEEVHDAGLRLSASFGYASHVPGERASELFARSDAALDRVKRFRACASH